MSGGRNDRIALHVRAFERAFGDRAGLRVFFAPGRVNLMGAHLDYNGGPVMPTAIDRGTFVAARPRNDRRVKMSSTLDASAIEIDLDAPPRARSGRWHDYPHGVLLEVLALSRRHATRSGAPGGTRDAPGGMRRDAPGGMRRDARGATRRDARGGGLEILFGGDLPVGAGLSSSASICVGTAYALDALWDLGLAPSERVDAALRAERGFVGVQCGIMDPFAVGLAREGHLLWLDCKDESRAYIPLDPARHVIAVADSLVRRELAQGAFNERVRQCKEAFERLRDGVEGAVCLRDVPIEVLEERRDAIDPTIARRAEHVIREVARTFAARDALLAGDPAGRGVEMVRTHQSLRDLFEVSVPELDHLVESAIACDGVLGSRLTGAGFGGCAVVLLERGAEEEMSARVSEAFERRFGKRPAIGLVAGDPGPRELAVA